MPTILTHTRTHTHTGRQPCLYDSSSQLHLFVLPGLSCLTVPPPAFFPLSTNKPKGNCLIFIYLFFVRIHIFFLTFKWHLLLVRGSYGRFFFFFFFQSIIRKTSSASSMLSSFAHRGSYNPQFLLWIANPKWSVWACWKPPWDTASQPSNFICHELLLWQVRSACNMRAAEKAGWGTAPADSLD